MGTLSKYKGAPTHGSSFKDQPTITFLKAMQEALPYKAWIPISDSLRGETIDSNGEKCVTKLVQENAVLLFGRRGCCMCHVMKRLLLGLGVNPAVFDVDEEEEHVVIDELTTMGEGGKDGRPEFPLVYIGGILFGGLDKLMGAHISGELVPVLKKAGALWL
ncbi:hypothetical protein GIB67_039255 [Kingdonia uniflora]|uniref:Glutaredoxin domain-containing protein n=1 Tax=Kingdonia uniflora TaxID=39325 RepID=A0A7J7MM86_9MAGN|nr:hypothetical protein GIB67_039255 [Kingdonia uniflora]